jgi:hypothetical protein
MHVLRSAAAAGAVLLAAACGGGFFPWPRGMPKPKPEADSLAYRVYVWNQGLGELTARDSRHGNVVHVLPGQTGVLHLRTEGRYRIIFTIAGQTYVTAMDFIPTPGQPCWGFLVSAAPENDVVSPVPIECP